MVKVVICNGKPGCGKTLFQNICKEKCNCWTYVEGFEKNHTLQIQSYSSISFVKEIAYECGWDGKKTLENRKFLSDLKDLLTNWNDVPLKKIIEKTDNLVRNGGDWILFVDCREPKEIEKLKQALNATTLLIRRDSIESEETSNHADANVFDYEYDLTILNNSDILLLESKADKFIEYMRRKEVPHYELRNN